MAIHESNSGKKCTLYLGAHEPAELHIGNKKIVGWKEQSQSGTDLTFEDTYNDKILSAKVKGNTVQKSEWVRAEAVSTQDGTPTPDNPIPVATTLPAGTYKTQDWRGDWYEFTLTEDLHGIDDVRDSVEWDKYSHNGYLRDSVGVLVFNGSETISPYLYSNMNGVQIQGVLAESLSRQSGICSHSSQVGKYYTSNSLWVGATDTYLYWIGILDILGFTADATGITAFKAWLNAQYTAGTPVTVVYQLATPTRTPLIFTKNNDSTAPELPMEFLTSVPSAEYPAELWDAEGEVSVRGKNLIPPFTASNTINNLGAIMSVISGGQTILVDGIFTGPTSNGRAVFKSQSQGFLLKAGITYTLSGFLISGSYTGGANLMISNFEGTTNTLVGVSNVVAPAKITPPEDVLCYVGIHCLVGSTFTNAVFAYQIELGSAATSYEPYRTPVTATIPPLRSVNDVADEYTVKTGKKTKRISDWEDFRNRTWSPNYSTNGYKGVASYHSAPTKSATSARAFKYTKEELGSTTGHAVNAFRFSSNQYPVVYIANADSGWSDAYTPTDNDTKAYFYGWQMCNEDGTVPYTAGTIHWKKLVGTEAEIAASLTSTLPTASYDGFTPYRMIYELAEPTIEQHEPATLPTYYPTTVIEMQNETPATATITATVKTVDLN